VGIYIVSISSEFYDDDVTVTSFINIKYGDVAIEIAPNEQCAVIVFLWRKKDFMQLRFIFTCIQYMTTNVLQTQQYTFGVRKC